MNFKKLISLLYVIIMPYAILISCEEKPLGELSASDGIVHIRKTYENQNWDKVIQEVSEFKSRYPYTQYAQEAELIQADAYFQSNRYIEASATYEDFLKRNPTSPQAPLASFRIATSLDKQSPEEPDREQGFTSAAIEKYNFFLDRFSDHPLATEARGRLKILKRRLAESETRIARFYWKKQMYHSALIRDLKVISDFPEFKDLSDESKKRAAEAYRKLGTQLRNNPSADNYVFFKEAGFDPNELDKKAKELQP